MSSARAVASTALIALATLGLVACGTPPMPEPPTAEQIEAIRVAQAEEWWQAMHPGQPVPDIDVVAVLPTEEAMELRGQCLEDADLPGVRVLPDGGWSIEGEPGDPAFIAADTQIWVCAQQYWSEGDTDYILSSSQLEWLYDFYVQRYQPCVGSMGYKPLGFPTRDVLVNNPGGYAVWTPHDFSLDPDPTADEWQLIAQRCPLPEMLAGYQLPGYRADERR